MRCYICDRALTEPVFNAEIDGYEPCDTCMAVIHDAIGNFTDKPAADEDAFDDELLELLYEDPEINL